MSKINAKGLNHIALNSQIRALLDAGENQISLEDVGGQRYIGAGLKGRVSIDIFGVPGNNLGALMSGPRVEVHGNAQDGVANTMNDGTIVIHGSTGDITGYSMRGGTVFIRGDVGCRVGIHMKAHRDKNPRIVVGGTAGDFLGEYMAGGTLVVLGLNQENGRTLVGNFVATGMHGGQIFVRGQIEPEILGVEAQALEPSATDRQHLQTLIGEFSRHFCFDQDSILEQPFTKIVPRGTRPYGNHYAY